MYLIPSKVLVIVDRDATSQLGTLQSNFAQLFTGHNDNNVVIL
jgi:hypothetical protein